MKTEHNSIYQYKFEVKLIVIMVLVLLMIGEWYFYKLMPDLFSGKVKLGEGDSIQVYTFFFAVGSFFMLIYIFKAYFFLNSRVDKFYKLAILVIYLLGLSLVEYAIYTRNIPLIHGSSFTIGFPSIFMSVVIFKELLIKPPKQKGEINEEK